jgi:hypothetical protein
MDVMKRSEENSIAEKRHFGRTQDRNAILHFVGTGVVE